MPTGSALRPTLAAAIVVVIGAGRRAMQQRHAQRGACHTLQQPRGINGHAVQLGGLEAHVQSKRFRGACKSSAWLE
jgi:hypothetical protein